MSFLMPVMTNERLEQFLEKSSVFLPRKIAGEIRDKIAENNTVQKVLLICGLRQTGKTWAMAHAISMLPDGERNRTAFITCPEGSEFKDLRSDILELEKLGFKNIFIDEATNIKDFIDCSSLFYNYFAVRGIKIVIAGTHSLGLLFSSRDELAGKSERIDSTWISFAEFARLKNIQDIDVFLKNGGSLANNTFVSRDTANDYVYTAIANNIQHSLACWNDGERFGLLEDLWNSDKLTDVIVRVVEDRNHRFLAKVINRNFKPNALNATIKNLFKRDAPEQMETISRILATVDVPAITSNIIRRLEIEEKKVPKITQGQMSALEEWLIQLDLVVPFTIKTPFRGNHHKRWLFSQQGMRAAHLEAIFDSMLEHPSVLALSFDDREFLVNATRQMAYGEMLEETILLDTMKAMKGKADVLSLELPNGEFDLVVHDKQNSLCDAIEIKHSSEVCEEQGKYLNNEENIHLLRTLFGCDTIRKRVLYRGENRILNELEYQNVGIYLNDIDSPSENIRQETANSPTM